MPIDPSFAAMANATVAIWANPQTNTNGRVLDSGPAPLAGYQSERCIMGEATPQQKQMSGKDMTYALFCFGFLRPIPGATQGTLVKYVDQDDGSTRTFKLLKRPEDRNKDGCLWEAWGEETQGAQ